GVSADSAAGKEIDSLTRATEGMKQLKTTTDDWKTSISDGFSSLSRRASSFSDILSELAYKLADMFWSQGFDMLWNSGGLGTAVSSGLSAVGISANANGTNNWRGGPTALNERGGEILNLPRGTQVIPHDISKRMADGAGADRDAHVTVSVDQNGNLQAYVDRRMQSGFSAYDRTLNTKVPGIMSNQNKRSG
ncbi:MAG: hypothetical protein L0G27_06870, partial [Paracoccus sp. (in: a-proteobacteria)]|nr:hypothetical protein [Paracoccus sp. (in: a-proteobacteria)]